MARINKNDHFAEGWQKPKVEKNYSDQIRDQGQHARQVSKVVEQQVRAAAAELKPTDSPKKADAPLVRPGSDVPQTLQRSRPEMQDGAARQRDLASQKFLEARKNAQNLQNLQTKAPVTRAGDPAATRQAIIQKGEANQANLIRQNIPQPQAPVARAAAKVAEDAVRREGPARQATRRPSAKPTDSRPLPKAAKKARDGQKSSIADQPRADGELAAPKVAVPVVHADGRAEARRPADESAEGDKADGKKKGGEARQSGGVYARPSNPGGELNALLGGGSGGTTQDQASSDGKAHHVDTPAARTALSESDPGLHIYNEFDEENPGVEVVKQKAQDYAMRVEKRLQEIAELDEKLGNEIRGMFTRTPLSQRIIGDLKEELGAADFHRSVYGGLIG